MLPTKQNFLAEAVENNIDRIKVSCPSGNKVFYPPFDDFLSDQVFPNVDFLGGKIVFQKKIDGKFQNVTKLRKILDTQKYEKLFINGYKKSPSDNVTPTAISMVPDEKFVAILRKLCYNSIQELPKSRNSVWLRNALTYVLPLEKKCAGNELKETVVGYVSAYLRAYIIIFDEFSRSSDEAVYSVVSRIKINQLLLSASHDGERIAFNNIIGQLVTLSCRQEALDFFEASKDLDKLDLLSKMYMDMGVFTYFGKNQISSDVNIKLQNIEESLRFVPSISIRKNTTLLLSVDESFFRIYGPQILFYAQHASDIDFNIIIISESEDESLLTDCDGYLQALSTFNKCPAPSNLHISVCDIPSFVVKKTTFFACARFIFLRKFLTLYDRVYVIDADMNYEQDPGDFVSSLKGPISVVKSKGLTRISPWRRTMGGNFLISRRLDERIEFSTTLGSYLIEGLAVNHSWMLDQNALTFALEQHYIPDLEDLGGFYRPFKQPLFRTKWEHNYRMHNRQY